MPKETTKLKFYLKKERSLIIIEAKIGGDECRNFIFDTGFEKVMLLDSIANKYKVTGIDTIVTQKSEFIF